MIKVPILMYHRIGNCPSGAMVPHHFVSVSRLERHIIAWKKFGFNSVPLHSLSNTDNWRKGSIGVTFDDGYENFESNAARLLTKHSQTGTVFVVTNLFGQTNLWDTQLGDVSEPLLTAETIVELDSQGFEIGSHTCNHVRLTQVDPEVAREEIEQSFRVLNRLLGKEPQIFCYPYGAHDDNVRTMVQNAGYRASCTVEKGWNSPSTNRYQWMRTNVRRDTSSPILFWKLWRQNRLVTNP